MAESKEDYVETLPADRTEAKKKMRGDLFDNKKKIARSAAAEIIKLKKSRKSINQKIQAIRDDVDAKGIDKKAFDDEMGYFEKNLREREGYDEGRELCRVAFAEQLTIFSGENKDVEDDSDTATDETTSEKETENQTN